MSRPTSAAFLAVCALAAAPAAQRGVTAITSKAEVHRDPRISPDGALVAFRGPGKIGVVGINGGAEGVLVKAPNLGDFLWAPTGSGIYFVEADQVKFVSRTGGSPRLVAKIPGQQHRIFAVDAKDGFVYGVRFDPTGRRYALFRQDTAGRQKSVDLVFSSLLMDELALDPSQTRILVRESPRSPFPPREYVSVDLQGKNRKSLTGKPILGQIQSGDWIDAGRSIAFTMISSTSNTWQIASVGPSSTSITMLTEGNDFHRRSVVSANRRWIVFEGTTTVGILPVRGGGEILLSDDGKTYVLLGPPSIDAAGKTVVFAATILGGSNLGQVYKVSLDRELHITPRAEIGKSFGVEMPIAPKEVGAVFVGIQRAKSPIRLAGVRAAFWIDPSAMADVVVGSGGGGKLSVTLPVPANPWLQGRHLLFQGVRLIAGSGGDFTRVADVRIF